MDLQALSLPDWMPWWAVVGVLVPVAFYLALFLMMPFSTFGLRARLRELEAQIEALHEELRALTLRLPERGLGRGLGQMEGGADPFGDAPLQPPIPPAPRAPNPVRDAPRGGGFGDPVADRMLAYMREKAQSEMNRAGEPRPARPRAEPRFVPAQPPQGREPDLPPPPPLGGMPGGGMPGGGLPGEAPEPDLPPPPRLPGRFGRRRPDDAAGDDRQDPPPGAPQGGPRIDWPR